MVAGPSRPAPVLLLGQGARGRRGPRARSPQTLAATLQMVCNPVMNELFELAESRGVVYGLGVIGGGYPPMSTAIGSAFMKQFKHNPFEDQDAASTTVDSAAWLGK